MFHRWVLNETHRGLLMAQTLVRVPVNNTTDNVNLSSFHFGDGMWRVGSKVDQILCTIRAHTRRPDGKCSTKTNAIGGGQYTTWICGEHHISRAAEAVLDLPQGEYGSPK